MAASDDKKTPDDSKTKTPNESKTPDKAVEVGAEHRGVKQKGEEKGSKRQQVRMSGSGEIRNEKRDDKGLLEMLINFLRLLLGDMRRHDRDHGHHHDPHHGRHHHSHHHDRSFDRGYDQGFDRGQDDELFITKVQFNTLLTVAEKGRHAGKTSDSQNKVLDEARTYMNESGLAASEGARKVGGQASQRGRSVSSREGVQEFPTRGDPTFDHAGSTVTNNNNNNTSAVDNDADDEPSLTK